MSVSPADIALVRAFNRDYTRRIGVLAEGVLDSPYSLTEVRVLYELAHREDVTAKELADDLHLDKGYLSRILKMLEAKRFLARRPAPQDARRQLLRLTPSGRRTFVVLNQRQQKRVREMLQSLEDHRQRAVIGAMQTIRDAFETGSSASSRPEAREPAAGIPLRAHRPGDMGWVVQRHGEIYAREYGWNEEFEALVAEITAEFIRKLDPARERCWIAEREGRRLGCIFLVANDRATAKLRLLLVEPEARGLGIGRALIAECVRFAREAGYRKIVLWTQSNLIAARHLYAEAGFRMTAREPHHSFGHDLVAETWELVVPS